MAETQPWMVANLCYSKAEFRQDTAAIVCGEGVVDSASLKVTTAGVGLGVNVAAGQAFIEGDDLPPEQGMYRVFNDGTVVLTANTADGTNPRIDTVVATVRDSAYGGSDDDWVLSILPGTPTVGANLTNKNGKATPGNDTIVLAYLLVPATFTGPFVDATHIQDARSTMELCGGGRATQVDVLGAGTSTWAMPVGAKSIHVICVGGGGGGGNAVATGGSQSSMGGGGGAGGIAEAWFDPSELASSCYYTAGAGGAGGAPGVTGGTSLFKSGPLVGDTTVVSAFGGTGGTASAASGSTGAQDGGTGGIGSVGDVLQGGGAGGVAIRYSSGADAVGGTGGAGQRGGGGNAARPSNAGSNGRAYGGGGGGACNGASQGAKSGGTGGDGVVIVETYF